MHRVHCATVGDPACQSPDRQHGHTGLCGLVCREAAWTSLIYTLAADPAPTAGAGEGCPRQGLQDMAAKTLHPVEAGVMLHTHSGQAASRIEPVAEITDVRICSNTLWIVCYDIRSMQYRGFYTPWVLFDRTEEEGTSAPAAGKALRQLYTTSIVRTDDQLMVQPPVWTRMQDTGKDHVFQRSKHRHRNFGQTQQVAGSELGSVLGDRRPSRILAISAISPHCARDRSSSPQTRCREMPVALSTSGPMFHARASFPALLSMHSLYGQGTSWLAGW